MKIALRAAVITIVLFIVGCAQNQPLPNSEEGLKQVLNDKFENPDAHYRLGLLYYGQKDYEKAEFEFKTASGFAPRNKWPDAALVRLYVDWGKKDLADAEFKDTLSATLEDEDLVMFARALQKEGLNDYAQSCYEYALGVAKNKGGIYREMGYYYLSLSDKVRAEEAFRNSLRLRPYQPDVSAELGRMGVKVVAPEIVHEKPIPSENSLYEEEVVKKK